MAGRLFHGDNLEVMRNLKGDPEVRERVSLVYMDPPFNTGGVFHVDGACGGRGAGRKIAYADRRSLPEYLDWMEERLRALVALLAPNASVYLHADARTVHYLKMLMDQVFGAESFVNEIIWHYRSGGTARTRYSAKHDTILWYCAGTKPLFNRAAVCSVERGGRRNHMKRSVNDNGEAVRTIRSNGKVYEYPEADRVPPSDVWADISHLNQRDPERTGYATQKPEALLERVVAGSSHPGDLVLDPFCGSGTTLAVAERLGRRWIGIDASTAAIEVAIQRLCAQGADVEMAKQEMEKGNQVG